MKLALTGNKRSGKTAFADYLQGHQWGCINYTFWLKDDLAQALESRGVFTSYSHAIDALNYDKDTWRPLITAWASLTGWDTGVRLDRYLNNTRLQDNESCVVDNVRYRAQADVCRKHGFLIVRLAGGAWSDEPSERAMDTYPVDMTLDIGKSQNVGRDYYNALMSSYANV